jgi:hypothetical protein
VPRAGRGRPGGQGSQLVECGVDLPAQPMEHLPGPAGILPHQLLGELEPNPQRHQALLATVVEITLDAAALFIGSGENAGPRRAQLGQ